MKNFFLENRRIFMAEISVSADKFEGEGGGMKDMLSTADERADKQATAAQLKLTEIAEKMGDKKNDAQQLIMASLRNEKGDLKVAKAREFTALNINRDQFSQEEFDAYATELERSLGDALKTDTEVKKENEKIAKKVGEKDGKTLDGMDESAVKIYKRLQQSAKGLNISLDLLEKKYLKGKEKDFPEFEKRARMAIDMRLKISEYKDHLNDVVSGEFLVGKSVQQKLIKDAETAIQRIVAAAPLESTFETNFNGWNIAGKNADYKNQSSEEVSIQKFVSRFLQSTDVLSAAESKEIKKSHISKNLAKLLDALDKKIGTDPAKQNAILNARKGLLNSQGIITATSLIQETARSVNVGLADSGLVEAINNQDEKKSDQALFMALKAIGAGEQAGDVGLKHASAEIEKSNTTNQEKINNFKEKLKKNENSAGIEVATNKKFQQILSALPESDPTRLQMLENRESFKKGLSQKIAFVRTMDDFVDENGKGSESILGEIGTEWAKLEGAGWYFSDETVKFTAEMAKLAAEIIITTFITGGLGTGAVLVNGASRTAKAVNAVAKASTATRNVSGLSKVSAVAEKIPFGIGKIAEQTVAFTLSQAAMEGLTNTFAEDYLKGGEIDGEKLQDLFFHNAALFGVLGATKGAMGPILAKLRPNAGPLLQSTATGVAELGALTVLTQLQKGEWNPTMTETLMNVIFVGGFKVAEVISQLRKAGANIPADALESAVKIAEKGGRSGQAFESGTNKPLDPVSSDANTSAKKGIEILKEKEAEIQARIASQSSAEGTGKTSENTMPASPELIGTSIPLKTNIPSATASSTGGIDRSGMGKWAENNAKKEVENFPDLELPAFMTKKTATNAGSEKQGLPQYGEEGGVGGSGQKGFVNTGGAWQGFKDKLGIGRKNTNKTPEDVLTGNTIEDITGQLKVGESISINNGRYEMTLEYKGNNYFQTEGSGRWSFQRGENVSGYSFKKVSSSEIPSSEKSPGKTNEGQEKPNTELHSSTPKENFDPFAEFPRETEITYKSSRTGEMVTGKISIYDVESGTYMVTRPFGKNQTSARSFTVEELRVLKNNPAPKPEITAEGRTPMTQSEIQARTGAFDVYIERNGKLIEASAMKKPDGSVLLDWKESGKTMQKTMQQTDKIYAKGDDAVVVPKEAESPKPAATGKDEPQSASQLNAKESFPSAEAPKTDKSSRSLQSQRTDGEGVLVENQVAETRDFAIKDAQGVNRQFQIEGYSDGTYKVFAKDPQNPNARIPVNPDIINGHEAFRAVVDAHVGKMKFRTGTDIDFSVREQSPKSQVSQKPENISDAETIPPKTSPEPTASTESVVSAKPLPTPETAQQFQQKMDARGNALVAGATGAALTGVAMNTDGGIGEANADGVSVPTAISTNTQEFNLNTTPDAKILDPLKNNASKIITETKITLEGKEYTGFQAIIDNYQIGKNQWESVNAAMLKIASDNGITLPGNNLIEQIKVLHSLIFESGLPPSAYSGKSGPSAVAAFMKYLKKL